MPSSLSLEGRVALVTGAGSGIGRATAEAFSKAGARVALVGRSADELQDTTEAICAEDGECIALVADVSDPQALQQAFQDVGVRFGRLDIVMANAGINGVWAPIEEIEPEEYQRTMGINAFGTFLTLKYATPYLRRQGGSILVTSSVNGTRIFSNTGATVYSASKAAQVAMVKMLAVELGPYGIRVNAICPGAIKTHIGQNTERRDTETIGVPVEFPEGDTPLRGEDVGSSEQVGRLALFLASDMADHITGEVVYIDGGSSLVRG